MDLFQAAILGLVQGLSEFLPISSSGHLIIVPALLGWGELPNKLSFDVALHLGTALAVIAYFWKDWVRLVLSLKDPKSQDARFLYLLIIGSIPAGVIGLIFDKWVENTVRSPWVVAFNLVLFALILWL